MFIWFNEYGMVVPGGEGGEREGVAVRHDGGEMEEKEATVENDEL